MAGGVVQKDKAFGDFREVPLACVLTGDTLP